jgi:SAM-dependent methyltransferase
MIITQPDRYLLIEQVRKFAPRLTGKILDVGSGRSRRYETFCTNKSSYVTMDHSTDGGPDIVGSAEAIPLPDASIDSIICTQVLEHLPHPHIAMKEMARILKAKGFILLTIPQQNELHEVPHDYFRYTCFGLRVLFEDAGFQVLEMDQRGKYHAMMTQIRIRHLINIWHPYERKWVMLVLAPLTKLLTYWSLYRDKLSRNPAAKLEAIGWCILAQKQ